MIAIKILGSLADDSQLIVTQTDYVLARDFLLTEVALMNVIRSGVLLNMTLNSENSEINELGLLFYLRITTSRNTGQPEPITVDTSFS